MYRQAPRSLVLNALERVDRKVDGLNPRHLLSLLAQGKAIAALAPPTSVLIALMDHSGRSYVCAAAGVLQDIVAELPNIERFFAFRGATEISVAGRNGWERVLKPHGYRRAGEYLVKEIRYG